MSEAGGEIGRVKKLRLGYAGTCVVCATALPAGTNAYWASATRTVTCLGCASALTSDEPVAVTDPEPPEAPAPIESGVAGASARREYERRQAKDEQQVRDKWGRFGGIAVAMSSERTSTKVWARGAFGEEVVGGVLDKLRSDDVAVFHDRRMPRKSSNIDHIVVTRSGIWVVDTKRYVDKRPALLVEGGILRPRTETLTVGGSRKGALVDGVLNQVAVVSAHVGDVPVRGALCFVDSDWPLFGGAFQTQGVAVLWPKKLAELITREVDGSVDVVAVAQLVVAAFKPA